MADGLDGLLGMGLDGIVIATPSAMHAEQSIRALQSGAAVFCQKPLGRTAGEVRRVVDAEGGCVVWGGAMALSPADDLIIQVSRPLDFDSDSQLAASVISKKVAAGSTHLLIDIPVGPTAKVRSVAASLANTARPKASARGSAKPFQ